MMSTYFALDFNRQDFTDEDLRLAKFIYLT